MHCDTLTLTADGSAFLYRALNPDGKCSFWFTFMLAELGTWEPEEVTRCVGSMSVGMLAATWKILNRFPYCQLLAHESTRRLAQVQYKPPTEPRAAYMAISGATGPERVLVHRCAPQVADTIVAYLPLAWLVRGGANRAWEALGKVMMRELVALHPDAFAPFPALLQAGGASR